MSSTQASTDPVGNALAPATPGARGSSVASAAPTVAPPSADPAWKYCTMPDRNIKAHLKCNFCSYVGTGGITRIKHHLSCLKKEGAVCCKNVPADVKEEMRKLLSKKDEAKEKRARAATGNLEDVALGNSDGSCDEGDILKGSSSSRKVPVYGSMDKFCTKTPEEILAARNAKGYSSKVQSKVTTQEREAKRAIACEYICQFLYDATIAHNATTLPSFHQVHTKRRTKLLHDRMRDLVFIKFNSRLKNKKQHKKRDPIEREVADVVLEDADNEWITADVDDVVLQDHLQEQIPIPQPPPKAARNPILERQNFQRKKKRKLIPVTTSQDLLSASSGSEDGMELDSASSAGSGSD